MPLNQRTPGSDQGGQAPAHSYPISRHLALMVLLALVALFALRHVFGSVHADVGMK